MTRPPHPCDDLPVGAWVWWCHHAEPLEQLTEPGRVRVDYIYAEKPPHEREVRLLAFRPAKDQSWAATALKAYKEARATAWKAYEEACATAMVPLFDRLDEEYPGVPYSRETGALVFPEEGAE